MKKVLTLLLLMIAHVYAVKKPLVVKSPTARDIIKQFSAASLQQHNGWECGYFAMFHVLKLRAALECKAVESMGQEDYEAWVSEILENDSRLVEKQNKPRDKDKYLGTNDIRRVLCQTIGIDKLPDDVFIFEDQNTALPLPHDVQLLDLIHRFQKDFRDTDKPFFIIACDTEDMHWIAVVLHGEECIHIDSLPGKKRAVVNKIQKLFYESKLPAGKDYVTVAGLIKQQLKKKKKIITTKNNAIKNHGFTKETFDALLKKIKHGRKSKKRESEVVEIDESSDDQSYEQVDSNSECIDI